MLMRPPMLSAPVSGVGPFVTSMRSTFDIVTPRSAVTRVEPPVCGTLSPAPSISIFVYSAGMPRRPTVSGAVPSPSTSTPGRYCRKSPRLSCASVPNASVAITSLMFRAMRFSLIAISAALISRAVLTRNAPSFTVSPASVAFCP